MVKHFGGILMTMLQKLVAERKYERQRSESSDSRAFSPVPSDEESDYSQYLCARFGQLAQSWSDDSDDTGLDTN
jgi:hypothetical protein